MKALCKQLIEAKTAEAAAKTHRLQIEQAILDSLTDLPLEGTKSHKQGGYKLTVTTKCKRKLDYKAYTNLDLPNNLSFVDLKPSLNLKKMRAIEMVDPDLVAKCVTVFPAKASIKVSEVTK